MIRDAVVVVTGASSGIGYATARTLAERGATVVGVARRAERLAELEAMLKAVSPRSFTQVTDLAEPGAARAAVEAVVARLGRLDVLVNNAALPKHKLIWHTDQADAEQVMRVNFLAAVEASLAALPGMLQRGAGCIVNVSSMAARIVPPRESLYGASKAALDAFTEGLWSDLQGSGIHAGLVIVGPIDTEIWDKLEEQPAYRGRRHPPRVAADAVLRVIEGRRHQVMAPRWSPTLRLARAVRALAPGLVRLGLRRMDPVPSAALDQARARAERRAGRNQADEA
jgi:short-subunit dehydrogenase